MTQTKQIVAFTVSMVIGGVIVATALSAAWAKETRFSCEHLANQSQYVVDFYVTQDQVDTCDSVGVAINAPIK